MPVGGVKRTGRYGGQPMNSNVVKPPGGKMLPGFAVGPDGKLTKDGKPFSQPKAPMKAALPAPPPVGSGGGPGVVSPTPKKLGTAGAQMAATPGPISGAAAAPPATTPNPAAYRASGGIAGPGTAVTPATNIPGSLPTDPVLDRMNGFASRYDPTQINQLMDNPNLILEDVLKSLGFSAGNTRMAEMGPYSENMLNLAGLLQMSGSLGGADQADETMINTVAELLSNGMGRGGQSVEYKNALGMLMSPKGAMDEYLFGAAGDDQFGLSQQAQALAPMFQSAVSGVNPFTQRAMGSAYRAAENSAQRALVSPNGMQSDPRILNYLRSNLRGIIPGF
jgi:hypothetical protein